MNEIMVKEEEQLKGLDPAKSAQIKKVFEPMVKMLEGFEGEFKKVTALEMSPDKCKQAKRLRLDIAKVRIEADKVRKIQKEEYLRAGNAIQGVFNILKFAVVDKEEKLKDIELYYEKLEAEKIRQLQADREKELLKYEVDGSTMDLGNMLPEVWTNFLAGTKSNYEAVKEAERKAEEERIERERKQALYETRLKALLVFGELFDRTLLTLETTEEEYQAVLSDVKDAKLEYDKEQEKIRKENERLRIEKEKAEKKRIAEQKKAAAKLKKEREEKEALKRKMAEQQAEKERIAKEEADRIAAEQKKAAEAPDKEKFIKLADFLKGTIGNWNSAKSESVIKQILAIVNKTIGEME